MKPLRILITGARAPVTLHLARLLHDAGHFIVLADSCRFPLSRASNAVSDYVTLPSPRHQTSKFMNELVNLIKQHEIDVVIPTCEEAFYLSMALPDIKSSVPECQVLVSELSVMHALHHKYMFVQHVHSLSSSIQSPETHLLLSSDDVMSYQSESRNWVFKPVYSRFAGQTLIQPSEKELCAITPSKRYPWIAQRFIPGTEYSTYNLVVNRELRAHVTYHSKYRAGKGSGVYFRRVEQPVIQQFVSVLAHQIQYTGQLSFDLIHGNDGNWYVLECNPRATSGVHLFQKSDNLPHAFLNERGGDVVMPSQLKCMLGAVFPIYGCSTGRPWYQVLCDMATAPDVVWDHHDPLPVVYQLVSLFEIIWKSLRQKSPLTDAATADIEWNGPDNIECLDGLMAGAFSA